MAQSGGRVMVASGAVEFNEFGDFTPRLVHLLSTRPNRCKWKRPNYLRLGRDGPRDLSTAVMVSSRHSIGTRDDLAMTCLPVVLNRSGGLLSAVPNPGIFRGF